MDRQCGVTQEQSRPRRRLARIITVSLLALTPGTLLGVYEITAQIGEGGMGQVYRTDTRLKRQVTLEILPTSLAGESCSPERR